MVKVRNIKPEPLKVLLKRNVVISRVGVGGLHVLDGCGR